MHTGLDVSRRNQLDLTQKVQYKPNLLPRSTNQSQPNHTAKTIDVIDGESNPAIINLNNFMVNPYPLNTEGPQETEGNKNKLAIMDQNRNKGTRSALIVLSAGEKDKGGEEFFANESKTLSDKQSQYGG